MSKRTQSLFLNLMLMTAVSFALISNASAEADPKLWPVVKEAFFAKRDIQEVDFIKIDAPGLERNNSTIELFNVTGASVLKAPLADKINVSQLIPGTYMVHITCKQQVYKAIFIKQ